VGGDRGLAGGQLVTHALDRFGGRADEDESGVGHGTGELGVLGEEAVAGVDRVHTGGQGDVDDPVGAQVALRGRGGAQQVRLVGQPDVRGRTVGLAVDGDRTYTELLAGTDDADGDLAAVGDQDGIEHGCPYS